jgi:nucleoside-diphosphate-sugar epimerase
MKIFVTGGTGFIGNHLLRYLSGHKDLEIYVLVSDSKRRDIFRANNIHFLEGNLFSVPRLPEDIECVYHLAGLTKASKSGDYYTVNQKGTASLFTSLVSQKIFSRVIFLSSLAAGGPSLNKEPVRESDPPHPVNAYGRSKLKAEEEALKVKDRFPVIILRAGGVYGAGDTDFLYYFKLVKMGLLCSLGFRPRPGSLCYIKDLVRVLLMVLRADVASGEIFNIADPKPYVWEDLGRAAANTLGKKLRRVIVPEAAALLWAMGSDLIGRLARRPSALNLDKYKILKQTYWVADVSKAREKLGFETRYSLQEAIDETIEWYVQNAWL